MPSGSGDLVGSIFLRRLQTLSRSKRMQEISMGLLGGSAGLAPVVSIVNIDVKKLFSALALSPAVLSILLAKCMSGIVQSPDLMLLIHCQKGFWLWLRLLVRSSR